MSTILHVDRIVVLDEGRIVGIDRHEDSCRAAREYRELLVSQLGEEAV